MTGKYPVEYLPYDDQTQLARQIKGYPLSFTRTPQQPLVHRPVTLTELTGPAEMHRRWPPATNDLSRESLEDRALSGN